MKHPFAPIRPLIVALVLGLLMLVPFVAITPAVYAVGAQCYWDGAPGVAFGGKNDCSAFSPDVTKSIQDQSFDPNDGSLCFYIVLQNGAIFARKQPCEYQPFTDVPNPNPNAQTIDQISQNDIKDTTSRNAAANCDGSSPDQLNQCLHNNPLVSMLTIFINFLGVGVGVIVVIMVIVGGIQYTTAGGNPQAVSAARKRILNAIIALIAFLLLYSFLQWLVPGGLF